MKEYKIGYTQGVYDMFHVGHLNLINNAKKYCDYLIVGVNSDRLVADYKCKIPVVNETNRSLIVNNIKAVDQVIIADTLNKQELLKILNYDVVFIGDDWQGSPRWISTESELKKFNVDVLYLPHTEDISSTKLRILKDKVVND